MEKFNYKREFFLWILLILPIVHIIYIWGSIPDIVPIHFDINGEANGWGSKWALFLVSGLSIGTYLLLLFLPYIDPKRLDNSVSVSLFYKIRVVLVVFMSTLSILVNYIITHEGKGANLGHWIPATVFLFLSVLGNFMISIKPNWFIGVRTPWTLSSDQVWKQTHLVMGRIWFYGGLICAALCLLNIGKWIGPLITVFVGGSAIFAFAYSFWLYKHEQKSKASQS